MKRATASAICLFLAVGNANANSLFESAERAEAKKLIEEGNRLFRSGKYREATKRYLWAIRRFDTPKLHYNLGMAFESLGEMVDARRHFSLFLKRSAAPSVQREMAKQAMARLEAELAQISFRVEEPNVTLSMNGKPIGKKERTQWVKPGRHRVRASSSSLGTVEKSITLRPRQHSTIELEVPTAATEPPPPNPAFGALTPPGPELREIADDGDAFWHSPWFWTGVGIVAAAGTGLGLYLGTAQGPSAPEMGRISTLSWGGATP